MNLQSIMLSKRFQIQKTPYYVLFFFIYINEPIYYRLAIFQSVELPLVFQFLQPPDGRLHRDRSGLAGPGTTSCCFHAGATVPDPHSSSLHLDFATEGASVLACWLI